MSSHLSIFWLLLNFAGLLPSRSLKYLCGPTGVCGNVTIWRAMLDSRGLEVVDHCPDSVVADVLPLPFVTHMNFSVTECFSL